MPVVLRRDGNEGEERWRFLGCCYVHGLMTGDLWPREGSTSSGEDLCGCLIKWKIVEASESQILRQILFAWRLLFGLFDGMHYDRNH